MPKTVPIVYLFQEGGGGRVWVFPYGPDDHFTPWTSGGVAVLEDEPDYNEVTGSRTLEWDYYWSTRRIDNQGNIVDGADLSPVSVGLDLDALWGLKYIKDDLDPTFYNDSMTFPDEWLEMTWEFVCTTNQGYSYFARYTSPRFGGTSVVQSERLSEAWPNEGVPMPVSLSLATESLVPGVTTSPSTINGEWRSGYFLFFNESFQSFNLSGEIKVDWGDGTISSYPFAYTMPGAEENPPTAPSARPQMFLKHVCYFSIRTDPELTEPAAPEVIVDEEDGWLIVEQRFPLLTHEYITLENTNPRIWVESNAGNTTYTEHDPVPVANWEAADGGDLEGFGRLFLDGSRSFDLTDEVNLWFWYWQPYVEGEGQPAIPPEPGGLNHCYAYDNPIIDRDDLAPGKYWVSLNVAVGTWPPGVENGVLAGDHNFFVPADYREATAGGPTPHPTQTSLPRVKLVTILPKGGRFGSFVDGTRTLYSAVNAGDDVQVSRFQSGAASRELLALIADAKNPSLYPLRERTIVCGYTRRDNGNYVEVESTDGGRTFS